jgi:hypothetical protein
MVSSPGSNTSTGQQGHEPSHVPPSPRVLVIDARRTRRNATVCQLTAMLPEVIVSECNDNSDALWRLAATKHDLLVLDVASCGEQAHVASQYWQLTAPDMQQILIYEDAAALSHVGGSDFDLARCHWNEMPAPLMRWVHAYLQGDERGAPRRSR